MLDSMMYSMIYITNASWDISTNMLYI